MVCDIQSASGTGRRMEARDGGEDAAAAAAAAAAPVEDVRGGIECGEERNAPVAEVWLVEAAGGGERGGEEEDMVGFGGSGQGCEEDDKC